MTDVFFVEWHEASIRKTPNCCYLFKYGKVILKTNDLIPLINKHRKQIEKSLYLYLNKYAYKADTSKFSKESQRGKKEKEKDEEEEKRKFE